MNMSAPAVWKLGKVINPSRLSRGMERNVPARIDQFVLGVLAFSLRAHLEKRHILMFVLFIGFATFYWYFDALGGFYNSLSYPSPYPLWIVMPTIEALFFSSLIAYYDTSFAFTDRGLSGVVAKVGAYSYSIYLTHFFYVFWMGQAFFSLFQTRNFYFATLAGLVCFAFAALLASFSYRYVELPFLQLRRKYVAEDAATVGGALRSAPRLSIS